MALLQRGRLHQQQLISITSFWVHRWCVYLLTLVGCFPVRPLKAQHEVNQAVDDLHKAAWHLLAAAPRRLGVSRVLGVLVAPVPGRLAPLPWIISPRVSRRATNACMLASVRPGGSSDSTPNPACTQWSSAMTRITFQRACQICSDGQELYGEPSLTGYAGSQRRRPHRLCVACQCFGASRLEWQHLRAPQPPLCFPGHSQTLWWCLEWRLLLPIESFGSGRCCHHRYGPSALRHPSQRPCWAWQQPACVQQTVLP